MEEILKKLKEQIASNPEAVKAQFAESMKKDFGGSPRVTDWLEKQHQLKPILLIEFDPATTTPEHADRMSMSLAKHAVTEQYHVIMLPKTIRATIVEKNLAGFEDALLKRVEFMQLYEQIRDEANRETDNDTKEA